MPAVSRSRLLGSGLDDVWRVVSDPHHLPRWWPKVQRVEGVAPGRFTQVLQTAKGRPVRADFRLVDERPPAHLAWEQELAGTPFERLLTGARTEVELASEDERTRVTLTLDRDLRGWSRVGPFFFSGAAKKELDAALDGLERACA